MCRDWGMAWMVWMEDFLMFDAHSIPELIRMRVLGMGIIGSVTGARGKEKGERGQGEGNVLLLLFLLLFLLLLLLLLRGFGFLVLWFCLMIPITSCSFLLFPVLCSLFSF